MLSASEGLCPLTPDQGLCPWTPLGALPPDPRYRLALDALALCPPKLPMAPLVPVLWRRLTGSLSASLKKIPRLVGRIGSGPRFVADRADAVFTHARPKTKMF